MSKKCSTAQRFIRTEMTTYRIGTLAANLIKLPLERQNVNNRNVWLKIPQNVSKPALISTCFFKCEEISSNMWFSPSAGMSNFECWNSNGNQIAKRNLH